MVTSLESEVHTTGYSTKYAVTGGIWTDLLFSQMLPHCTVIAGYISTCEEKQN
jgi:hypothetical protein